MDGSQNVLGDYLRARRELVAPEDVGIRSIGTRRVTGLRREEVALLAGISAEYYLRLEQGRDRRPSRQVLSAIAGVLRLNEDHLVHLAADRAPTGRRRRSKPEVLPESTARLIACLQQPAFAEGRYLDVLAVNPLATAISPRLAVGRNRLRDIFLNSAEQALFIDGPRAAAALTAGFRRSVGSDIDDPRVIELVGELSLASELFRRLWARHDVSDRGSASVLFDHPQVGMMQLDREKLAVSGSEGIMLVIYQPTDEESTHRLALLASAVSPMASARPDDQTTRRTYLQDKTNAAPTRPTARRGDPTAG